MKKTYRYARYARGGRVEWKDVVSGIASAMFVSLGCLSFLLVLNALTGALRTAITAASNGVRYWMFDTITVENFSKLAREENAEWAHLVLQSIIMVVPMYWIALAMPSFFLKHIQEKWAVVFLATLVVCVFVGAAGYLAYFVQFVANATWACIKSVEPSVVLRNAISFKIDWGEEIARAAVICCSMYIWRRIVLKHEAKRRARRRKG